MESNEEVVKKIRRIGELSLFLYNYLYSCF